ncbi:MAG: tRNA (adenosine(37)-N6)-dimethylallyltransferase MiaA [Eubacteriales bacterium]|nr:tRNA (adenosine(37)-N6)-dimethylallyltransferase MiaA [Eubacteriales bacterium]
MKNVIFVVGPTASGKTEYAIRLAEHFNGEIVSADSMQIYKYMDIGSAKPSQEQLQRIPHHLIGGIEPAKPFSAAEYKELAEACIERIFLENKLPLICGGTGLYVNALLYDMDFSAAPGDREKRDRILSDIGRGDPERLHAHLKELDPEAAQSIHPNNVKRVLRAIERLESGQEERLMPFSMTRHANPAFSSIVIGLERERQALYRRIEERVEQLLKQGLTEEVRRLLELGLTEEDISMKGIGYKELIPYLRGCGSLEQAVHEIKIHTRRYAKRQMTWFGRIDDIRWFKLEDTDFDEKALLQMIEYVEERRCKQ